MEYSVSLHNSQAEEGLTPAASAAPYLAPPHHSLIIIINLHLSQSLPIHTPLQPWNTSIHLPLQNCWYLEMNASVQGVSYSEAM